MPTSSYRRFMRRTATYSSWSATASSQSSLRRIARTPVLPRLLLRSLRAAVTALNQRRAGKGLPVTDMYLGLHVGEVFYGNIGSTERLDFTVVGPAVNEASRIAAMCRSVEQPVLVSAAFADVDGMRRRLVSVGRYALRGVAQPQEL